MTTIRDNFLFLESEIVLTNTSHIFYQNGVINFKNGQKDEMHHLDFL